MVDLQHRSRWQQADSARVTRLHHGTRAQPFTQPHTSHAKHTRAQRARDGTSTQGDAVGSRGSGAITSEAQHERLWPPQPPTAPCLRNTPRTRTSDTTVVRATSKKVGNQHGRPVQRRPVLHKVRTPSSLPTVVEQSNHSTKSWAGCHASSPFSRPHLGKIFLVLHCR